MRRRTRVILLVALGLEVLGYGGWLGQVWWAKRLVSAMLGGSPTNYIINLCTSHGKGDASNDVELMYASQWKEAPWYGHLLNGNCWWPRRFYYEFFCRLTGLDLGNNPSAWEAWFKAHPNLVWDEKLKRLVEPKP